ncbi:MAG TPA: glycerate kinase, partial [Atopostipes sp.]|nr:glycerate kinase [Atopostipes sp.]
LTHYAGVLKSDLGKDVANIPGSGAAGGLGAGLLAFLNANLKRGVDVVIESVQLESMMKGASLAVTGEGKLDHQTAYGKTPMGVAKIAKKYGVPVIGIAGMIEMENVQMKASGIDAIFPIVPGPIDVKDAMEHAIDYTERAAENIAEIIKISLNKDF